jgi:hypothetical protein
MVMNGPMNRLFDRAAGGVAARPPITSAVELNDEIAEDSGEEETPKGSSTTHHHNAPGGRHP